VWTYVLYDSGWDGKTPKFFLLVLFFNHCMWIVPAAAVRRSHKLFYDALDFV
jgi:hypothetical protein